MVIAETAISTGKSAGSISSRSMTTDVSMRPRGWRGSATRHWILIDSGVYVFPKTSGRNAWSARESGKGSFGRHEHPLSQRNQLTNRHAIACDDECLPLVQGPHDSPAFVAELTLGDPSTHCRHCSTRATRAAIPPERRRLFPAAGSTSGLEMVDSASVSDSLLRRWDGES